MLNKSFKVFEEVKSELDSPIFNFNVYNLAFLFNSLSQLYF